jgi:hypothetical protein
MGASHFSKSTQSLFLKGNSLLRLAVISDFFPQSMLEEKIILLKASISFQDTIKSGF